MGSTSVLSLRFEETVHCDLWSCTTDNPELEWFITGVLVVIAIIMFAIGYFLNRRADKMFDESMRRARRRFDKWRRLEEFDLDDTAERDENWSPGADEWLREDRERRRKAGEDC